MLLHRSPRAILVTGDAGMLLAMPERDAQAFTFHFAAAHDRVAQSEIKLCLQQNPRTKLVLLYNGSAQEFRSEILPPLHYFDRMKLVRRRLAQNFPRMFAVAARSLDRRQSAMAALQESAALQPWFDAAPADKVEAALLPLEAAAMLTQLLPRAKQGWAMLLAVFETGGLRQIVTQNGRLIFTRLAHGFDDGADPAAQMQRILDDTRAYLARFGLTQDMELETVLLTGEILPALPHVTIMNLSEAGRLLGMPAWPQHETFSCDAFFALWASRRKPWLSLMPPAIAAKKRQLEIGFAGWRVTAATAVLAVGLTLWSLCGFSYQLYQNYRSASEVGHLRAQLADEQAQQAPLGQPLGRLRAAIERQRLFRESQPAIGPVFQTLAHALDGKALATRLDWRSDQSLILDLRLSGDGAANLDRETTVQKFTALAASIAQAAPAYEVSVTRYPFPAMPQEQLTSAAMETAATAEIPTAELTLRKRP